MQIGVQRKLSLSYRTEAPEKSDNTVRQQGKRSQRYSWAEPATKRTAAPMPSSQHNQSIYGEALFPRQHTRSSQRLAARRMWPHATLSSKNHQQEKTYDTV